MIQHIPIPAQESTLLLFVTHLAISGLSHTTIKVYLSAIRSMHVATGQHAVFHQQLTPRLQQVLKGIQRTQAVSKSPRVRRPITLDIMKAIFHLLFNKSASYDNALLWAACCTAFFGFLRSSEMTVPSQATYDPTIHLSMQDVAVDNRSSPSLVRILIKQSKTDPFRQGVYIYLGRTGNAICPVQALLSYLALRGDIPGPLFIFQTGRMSPVKFLVMLWTVYSTSSISRKTTLIPTASALEPPPLQKLPISLTHISKCSADGKAMLISFTSRPRRRKLLICLGY